MTCSRGGGRVEGGTEAAAAAAAAARAAEAAAVAAAVIRSNRVGTELFFPTRFQFCRMFSNRVAFVYAFALFVNCDSKEL